MTSINFKVIGLTPPGFVTMRFTFPDLPMDALLIRPPFLVQEEFSDGPRREATRKTFRGRGLYCIYIYYIDYRI